MARENSSLLPRMGRFSRSEDMFAVTTAECTYILLVNRYTLPCCTSILSPVRNRRVQTFRHT